MVTGGPRLEKLGVCPTWCFERWTLSAASHSLRKNRYPRPKWLVAWLFGLTSQAVHDCPALPCTYRSCMNYANWSCSITSGVIVYAVAKHASDRFKSIAASILPFVFVAKHDPNEQVKDQFQKAWSEAVGGQRAVVLYLNEIVSLSSQYLDSSQWVLKHTSARAVADATTTVASMESTISPGAAAVLWPSLEKALGGKTWDGKEVVLSALVRFVESAAPWYSQQPAVATAIVKVRYLPLFGHREFGLWRPRVLLVVGSTLTEPSRSPRERQNARMQSTANIQSRPWDRSPLLEQMRI
jgi:hypothetical protein